MVHCVRRLILPAALVVLIALVSAGRVSTPTDVRAAFDPNGPAFDELSLFDTSTTPAPVKQPPRLLAGTNSHSLPADPAARNGYCVDVNIDGVTPVESFIIPSSAFGFLLTASDPIDPNASASVNIPVPAAGTYVYGAVVGAGAAVLNAATPGASPTSQHVRGEAADIVVPGWTDGRLRDLWAWIGWRSGIAYGQVIYEDRRPDAEGGAWLHVSLGAPWRGAARCGQRLTWDPAAGYRRWTAAPW